MYTTETMALQASRADAEKPIDLTTAKGTYLHTPVLTDQVARRRRLRRWTNTDDTSAAPENLDVVLTVTQPSAGMTMANTTSEVYDIDFYTADTVTNEGLASYLVVLVFFF